MSEILSINDLELGGAKVFVRCDFNVPMDEFLNITDDRRIRSAIPTIRYCLDNGCSVVLASHLGRPKNGFEEKFSLRGVAKRLSRLLDRDVIFAEDVIGADAKAKAAALKPGEILLLENLRFEKGETKNDEALAGELAKYGEFYINDAFGVCHRAHSSVEAITKFYDEKHKAAGFLLQKEINFAQNLIKHPARPFVAVVGGSKVSGKMHGQSVRVPVANVSMVDLTAILSKSASAEEINAAFREAAGGSMKGILLVDDDSRVSSDFCTSSHSSIVASDTTQVICGDMAKIFAWYDNEWGYSHRLVDLAVRAVKG